MEERFALPAPYLHAIAAELDRHGGGAAAWLAEAGLDGAARALAPGDEALGDAVEIAPALFVRLVQDAIARTGEPALGLFVGQRLPVTAHGVLGYAVQTCSSLAQAFALFEGFLELRFPLLALEVVSARRSESRVVFRERRPLGAAGRPTLEAVMIAIKNIVDGLVRGPSRVARVSFAGARPAYAAIAREIFGAELTYGATWSGFSLSSSAMASALPTTDPSAFREAIAVCERELARLPKPRTTAERVRQVLLEPQRAFPSLPVTARVLRLGPRTLHRRLVAEGTSYREVLEDVRRTLALEHVKQGQLSLTEIATMLGYSDVSNFRRAFRRWERENGDDA